MTHVSIIENAFGLKHLATLKESKSCSMCLFLVVSDVLNYSELLSQEVLMLLLIRIYFIDEPLLIGTICMTTNILDTKG